MFLKINSQTNQETLVTVNALVFPYNEEDWWCTHIQRDEDCQCLSGETLYLKHKGVIELRMTSFPSCFGLTVSSAIRRQQLQFYQCDITLALSGQVSSMEQRHHQRFSLLLIRRAKHRWTAVPLGRAHSLGSSGSRYRSGLMLPSGNQPQEPHRAEWETDSQNILLILSLYHCLWYLMPILQSWV